MGVCSGTWCWVLCLLFVCDVFVFFLFFEQETAYVFFAWFVGSEMCFSGVQGLGGCFLFLGRGWLVAFCFWAGVGWSLFVFGQGLAGRFLFLGWS